MAAAGGLRCDLTVVTPSGAEKRFVLRAGGAVRVGRKGTCNVLVEFEGVSGIHAELLLLPLAEIGNVAAAGEALRLCIRDISRNGTGVRLEAGSPWEALAKGVARELSSGWQLKIPLKSRQGHVQLSEADRLLTVRYVLEVEAPEPEPPSPQPVRVAAPAPPPPAAGEKPALAALPAELEQAHVDDYGAAFVAEATPADAQPAVVQDAPMHRPRRQDMIGSSPEPEEVAPPPPVAPAPAPAPAVTAAPVLPEGRPAKKRKTAAATEQQTRRDAVAAFWAQQVPQMPNATAAVAAAASARPKARPRTRSRSRVSQDPMCVPRDMSVSPISEPGVLKKRRKKDKKDKTGATAAAAVTSAVQKERKAKKAEEKKKRAGKREA